MKHHFTSVSECRWCHGRGSLAVGGGSLRYACPDCDGAGEIEHEDQEPAEKLSEETTETNSTH